MPVGKRIRLWISLGALGIAVMAAGCGTIRIQSIITPSATAAPTERIPTMTASATEERVWFPPTVTPLPLSTPTPYPTPGFDLNLGDLLYEDDFSDEAGWQTFRSDSGNAVIANQELTLAIQNKESQLTSYATLPWQSDFYLKMDVKVSLCSDAQDAYGILFRVADSDNYDRLWINCLGQTRIERRYKGEMLPLYDWAVNGKLRPGAPQRYTLALRVKGSRLSVFINDTLLYETSDVILKEGGLGVTARSRGLWPLTVAFSNFELYAVE